MTTFDSARVDGPILRCVRLIRLLAEIDRDVSVKEAALHLDLPSSTTHRLLRLLTAEGIVAKDPATSRYRAGLDLERIGSQLAFKGGFRDRTRPYLQRVVDQCDEACLFMAYLPATHQVSLMAAVNSSHPLRYEMTFYVPQSVAWGARGRSVLAFLPQDEQRAIAATAAVSPVTGEPLPEWDALKAELDRISERGYSFTRGQKLQGAVGIGVPVRDGSGAVIGSFCITIPEIRFEPALEQRLAGLLLEQAEAFNATVGRYGSAGRP